METSFILGIQNRWQEELFVVGPLSSLIPDDHILKQVDTVLDLSWLRRDVSDLYCQTNGRPGIDPEAAVRLLSDADQNQKDSFVRQNEFLEVPSRYRS